MRVAGPTVTLCGWVAILCASVAVAQNPTNNANWPSERPPRPLAARQMNFPPFEVRTLDNGLRVLTILQHEQPAITVRLIVGVGAAQDPDRQGRPGEPGGAAARPGHHDPQRRADCRQHRHDRRRAGHRLRAPTCRLPTWW